MIQVIRLKYRYLKHFRSEWIYTAWKNRSKHRAIIPKPTEHVKHPEAVYLIVADRKEDLNNVLPI